MIWWLNEVRLPPALFDRIEVESPVFVSIVTPWELWIKASAGRISLPPTFLSGLASEDALTILQPSLDDARLAASLPLLHRDPFDRMIIAQALNTGSTVVTGDRHFAAYGVDVILV